MEFNAIVGNPPYQLDSLGKSRQATPVYNHFVENIIKLPYKYINLIFPSRWFSGGFGLKSFRRNMLNNKNIQQLIDYPKPTEIFDSVIIAGGLCILLFNKDKYNNTCEVVNVLDGKYSISNRPLNTHAIFVRDNQSYNIINKVLKCNKSMMDIVVSSQKPFGIPTKYLPKEDGDIDCWFIRKYGKKKAYKKDVKDKHNILNKWKLLVPKAPISGQTGFTKPVRIYYKGNIRIAKPNECCTESWVVVGAFDTENELLNFKSYLLTKTVRFLLLQAVVSQDILRNKYCFVPALGKYEEVYSDAILCKRWGISEEDFKYINERIKD